MPITPNMLRELAKLADGNSHDWFSLNITTTRALVRRGLVAKLVDNCYRVAITDAGRAALAGVAMTLADYQTRSSTDADCPTCKPSDGWQGCAACRAPLVPVCSECSGLGWVPGFDVAQERCCCCRGTGRAR